MKTAEDFIRSERLVSNHDQTGSITWKSPSNIALVKYWGKRKPQLPRNPNVSLTLQEAHTITTIDYAPRTQTGLEVQVTYLFEGQNNPAFTARIQKYLNGLKTYLPWLDQVDLKFSSTNSFPHSSGIASSASSMAAIALGLCSMEQHFFGGLQDRAEFFSMASFLARLGSGSACRSVFPAASVWGDTIEVEGSSDLFGVDIHTEMHQEVIDAHDTICIVHAGEKSVSSSAGHSLMDQNPYSDIRFSNARNRLHQILPALRTADWSIIGRIMEQEALELHALMMTSNPSYILMRSGTLSIIEKIYAYRHDTKHPVYFTLDAGPNVHIIYPNSVKMPVQAWIADEIAPFCENGRYLLDEVGPGPEIIQ